MSFGAFIAMVAVAIGIGTLVGIGSFGTAAYLATMLFVICIDMVVSAIKEKK